MPQTIRIGVLALVSLLIGPAHAQMVVNASVAGLQPQVARDEKGFKSCGLRAVVVLDGTKSVRTYDFSINLNPDMLSALIKAGSYQGAKNAINQPAPVNVWIVEAIEAKRLQPYKIIPAETPGFILGLAEYFPAMTTMRAMAQGRRMQFAIRYKDEPLDKAVSFQQKMELPDAEALLACLEGLQPRLDAAIEAAQKAAETK